MGFGPFEMGLEAAVSGLGLCRHKPRLKSVQWPTRTRTPMRKLLLASRAARPTDRCIEKSLRCSAVDRWHSSPRSREMPHCCPAHSLAPIFGRLSQLPELIRNWAERAAALGWSALALFGCHRTRPLEHLGSAGLLWVINGGNLVELRRDWAVIEREGGSRHIYHRRPLDTPNVTLPWIGLSRPTADQR